MAVQSLPKKEDSTVPSMVKILLLKMYAAVISAERAKSSKKKKALAKSKKRKAKAVEMSNSNSSVSSTGSINAMTEMEHLKS